MEEEDRISDIPDEVLEHILSFLTIKEAVQTKILSNRWKRIDACSILTNINFSKNYFHGYLNRKKDRRLLNVIDKIILARSRSTLGIREFSVDLSCIDSGTSKSSLQLKLERWMKYLPIPNLTTLVFFLSGSDSKDLYDLSLSNLAYAHSLQNLFLSQFHLTCLSSCDIVVGFSSLRSLKLWVVRLDDEVMQQLLKGCPLLEILELECIPGLQVLEVIGFCHLKMLTVNCCSDLIKLHIDVGLDLKNLNIDVVNLELLKLTFPEYMMDMATCVLYLRQFEFNLINYDSVPKLELQGLHLPLDTWFSRFLSLCSLLEHITLSYYPTLNNFHSSTPFLALKTLHLHQLRMTSFKIVAPNLEKLLIHVDRYMPFVELNASDKLEVEIIFYSAGRFDNLLDDRLAKFFGFFSHSRVVKLSPFGGDEGYYFIPKEKRIKFHSPLHGTKCLELLLGGWKRKRKVFSKYLDYMLWLSPCATNLTIREDDEYYDNNTEIFLEFLYEEKARTENSNCSCCKLSFKCWRHYLKEVRILKFVGDEVDKAAIKQFLWEEIENLSITETSVNPDSIYGGQYASYDQLFN